MTGDLHYAHRHIVIDTGRDVVVCNRCGSSEVLDQSASVALDTLHDFIDGHADCPNPFGPVAA